MARIYWKVSGTTLYLRNDSATEYSAWTEPGRTSPLSSPPWSTNTNRSRIDTINIQNSITPTYFYRWFYNFSKLQTITNWDNLELTNITGMDYCFFNCRAFNQLITIPDHIESLFGCFNGCTSFNQPIEIPESVTDMEGCFSSCTSFNQPIIIPSNVTNMNSCFYGCTSFNQPITILSNVIDDISWCFANCDLFNQLIDISNAHDMENCFSNCTSFNQPVVLPDGVTNINGCFHNTPFNQPIEIPDSVETMGGCFQDCSSFNQPITIPDGVEDISACFGGCESFNQPIIIPDSVIDMNGCFYGCTSFNQSITIPDSVNNIRGCFYKCTSLTGIIEINASINDTDDYELCFDSTIREIILCRSNDNDISPTAEQLQHYADTCNYNNVKVGKLAVVLEAERDDDNNEEIIRVSVTINRFRYGELSSLNLYKDDSLISTTWTPSSLTIDTNNKVFETTINNVDENSIVNIKVEAIDGYSSIEKIIRVGKAYHTIDILAGGKEIAFGSSAKETDLHTYNRLSELPADFHTNPGGYYRKTNTGGFEPFPYDPPWSDEQIIDYGVYEYEEYHDSLFKCSMDADFEEPVAFGKVPETFVVTTETFSYPAISSGSGSGVRTATFSKQGGYYPVGVVGFRAGHSHAVAARFNLSSRSSGECELSYYLRAVDGNVSASSGNVYILWIKEI